MAYILAANGNARCSPRLRDARLGMRRNSRCAGTHLDCPACTRALLPWSLGMMRNGGRSAPARRFRYGGASPRSRRATARLPRRYR
jgi:hypothetical protein